MNKKIFLTLALGIGLLSGLIISFSHKKRLPKGFITLFPTHDICAMVIDTKKAWAGGRDGVFEIDLKNPKRESKLGKGIVLDYVRALALDEEKTLWIGTIHGLWCYKKGKLYQPFKGKFSQKRINAVFFDSQKRLWIGTWDGVYCFDGAHWIHYTKEDGLADDMVNVIFETDDGDMVFGSYVSPRGGISILDKKTKSWYTINCSNGLAHVNITSIIETSKHILWVGAGLFNYGGTSLLVKGRRGRWSVFKILGQKDGLSGAKTRALFIDSSKNIWLGTEYDGVNFIQNGVVKRILSTQNGLCHNEVKCIAEDSKGCIWFGTKSGITIYTAK